MLVLLLAASLCPRGHLRHVWCHRSLYHVMLCQQIESVLSISMFYDQPAPFLEKLAAGFLEHVDDSRRRISDDSQHLITTCRRLSCSSCDTPAGRRAGVAARPADIWHHTAVTPVAGSTCCFIYLLHVLTLGWMQHRRPRDLEDELLIDLCIRSLRDRFLVMWPSLRSAETFPSRTFFLHKKRGEKPCCPKNNEA